MGWFSSKGSWGDKAAVSRADRARAIRVQERYEREEKQAQRDKKLARDRDKGAAKGFWSW